MVDIIDQKQYIAFFDFDGTISSQDTFFPFIIFVADKTRTFLKLWIMSPYFLFLLFLYMIKLMSNHTIKQKIMMIMLSGISEEKIEVIAQEFVATKLEQYIKPEIFSLVQKHLDLQHKVIIVSANLDIFLTHWARKYEINAVISTQLETADKGISPYLTGRILGKNCYGVEKVRRVKEYLQAKHIPIQHLYSYGYGDSKGDYQLLNFVNEGFWVEDVTITKWHSIKSRKIS
jgi:phosphatidylglycerophosphatase C